jgi:GNAT superfamily N-acetyltransferase
MSGEYVLRTAAESDADEIAALHAESWRSAYPGLVPDDFLGPALDIHRFAAPDADRRLVLLAVSSEGLVGFTCVLADADPAHGPLLDNLHVKPAWRGRGVGARLLNESRAWSHRIAPRNPMHLWVIEGNAPARAFYRALGGVEAGRRINLMAGTEVPAIRYTWPALDILDPQSLIPDR